MVDIMKTDKELALKYIKAVMEYGLYGKYDDSDTMVKALMNPVVITLDNSQKRQERNKENGSKGGQNGSLIMMRLGDWLEKV